MEKGDQSKTNNVESSFSDNAFDLCAKAKQLRTTIEEIPDVLSSVKTIQWSSHVQNTKTS